MSAFVPDAPQHRPGDTLPEADAVLTLTGERTIPDLDIENYWFRRHQVVYQRLAKHCVARRVVAVDYDAAAVAHVRHRYPRVEVMQANLAELPLPTASVDVVVNFQVIEHLWDQAQFVAECARVVSPSGVVMVSTPTP